MFQLELCIFLNLSFCCITNPSPLLLPLSHILPPCFFLPISHIPPIIVLSYKIPFSVLPILIPLLILFLLLRASTHSPILSPIFSPIPIFFFLILILFLFPSSLTIYSSILLFTLYIHLIYFVYSLSTFSHSFYSQISAAYPRSRPANQRTSFFYQSKKFSSQISSFLFLTPAPFSPTSFLTISSTCAFYPSFHLNIITNLYPPRTPSVFSTNISFSLPPTVPSDCPYTS